MILTGMGLKKGNLMRNPLRHVCYQREDVCFFFLSPGVLQKGKDYIHVETKFHIISPQFKLFSKF